MLSRTSTPSLIGFGRRHCSSPGSGRSTQRCSRVAREVWGTGTSWETLKDDFAAIERKLSEQLKQSGGVSVRPDDFVKLNAELQKAKLALDEIAKSRTRKIALRDELLRELKRLSDLWHKEFKEIEAEIKKLNDSQIALRIIPQYKGDKAAFMKRIADPFPGKPTPGDNAAGRTGLARRLHLSLRSAGYDLQQSWGVG